MKKTICFFTLLTLVGCTRNDGRRRQPDPRFATLGCINDSTEQEIFDENGKAYYEYVPCAPVSDSAMPETKFPCVNDSMETERFDDEGNAYYLKIPCPD